MGILKQALTCTLTALLLTASGPAAVRASPAIEDLTPDELGAYIGGLIDMLALTQNRYHDPEKAKCVYDWYYKTEGVPQEVARFLEAYPDRDPDTIVFVLAKRACKLAE